MALVLLPVLVLGGLEAGLRLAGYGHRTGFFQKITVGDRNYLVNNDDFSLRFFPPQLARWPGPAMFEAERPADTYRIFILGESAARGEPEPNYAASRYLQALLEARHPQTHFEVVNLGITAIDSHVILPIARDCARADGQLWIVYMGNNEMVGPFGAATVFGARALPLGLVRLNLALQETRTGQFLVSTMRHLAGKSKNTSWGGMEMFLENQIPPGDLRKETVYRNFDANLRDIVAAGMNSGAKVILNTVAVNLKDSPPFASLSNSNLPAADQQRFGQIFADAKVLQSQGDFQSAAGLYSQAVKLDPQFAEAHYRLAQCELEQTNSEATQQFQIACDTDALPFRTDTRINQVIRRLAQKRAGDRLAFCDAERGLALDAPAHILGDETFYEHVHFNFEGGYRLGKLWAEQIDQMLTSAGNPPATTNWASQADCDHALGLSIWNRQFALQAVIRRFGAPPLSTQFNNAERLEKVRTAESGLARLEAQPDAVRIVREAFDASIRSAPADNYLYEGLANFLEVTKDPQGAIVAYRKMYDLLPDHFYACFQLGRLLREQGRPAQGEPFLKQATELRPSLPEGWFELGTALAAQQKFVPALECMEHAARLRPQDSSYVLSTGQMLTKLNRHAEAIEHFRRAIQMTPDLWEAHFELGGELDFTRQLDEARIEFGEAARLNPDNPRAHFNYGVLLAKQSRLDEAQQEFESTLRLEPTNHTAQKYLAQVKLLKDRKP
jgi:tetratricopeptide (TPR) repeat protein